MNSNSRRIAKNTLLLYVRMLFTMAISLYTSRVVLNTLGVTDYGIYNVVGGVVSLFTFLSGSMATATQRYITFALGSSDGSYLKNVFSTSILIHALLAFIIIVLAETVGLWFLNNYMRIPENRMDAAFWVYQFSIFTCVVMLMSVPYNSLIIANERMQVFAYFSILDVSLKLGIVYVLLVLSFDKLKLYALLMFVVQLLIRIVYGLYCKRNFSEAKFCFIYNKALVRNMMGFASWNLFGSVASITYTQGINIILNMFFGPVVNAARGVAVQVQGVVSSFCANFQTAINPQITKSYAKSDFEYMHKLVFQSSKYSYFLVLLLSMPLFLETDMILTCWLKVVPEHTVNFLRLILCSVLIETLANSMMISVQATGNIKTYQIVVGGLLLFILPVSYIALKIGMAPEAVFVVYVFFSLIAQVFRVQLVSKMISLSKKTYYKEVLLPILKVTVLASVVPLVSTFFLPRDIVGAISVCLLCVLFSALVIYTVGCDRNEKTFIRQFVVRILKHG